MDEFLLFECPVCRHESVRNDHEELWQIIARSEKVCVVRCPSLKCGAMIKQCCECHYNETLETVQMKWRLGKRKKDVVVEHYQYKHVRKRKVAARMRSEEVVEERMEDVVEQRSEEAVEGRTEEVEFNSGGTADAGFGSETEVGCSEVEFNSGGTVDVDFGAETDVGCCVSLSSCEEDVNDYLHECESDEDTITDDAERVLEGEALAGYEFVQTFSGIDLDPYCEDTDVDIGGDMSWHEVEGNVDMESIDCELKGAKEVYPYERFDFMDRRKDENDEFKPCGDVEKVPCQNQIFVYQCHAISTLLSRTTDDIEIILRRCGGWESLVGRANIRRRERINAMADSEEARVMFRYFDFVMALTENKQEAFVDLLNEYSDLHNANKSGAGVRTRFPKTYQELRTMITKGENSILKNFPSPWVFDIANHACVSLKEVIRIYAALGADFDYAWDARAQGEEKRNKKHGLNSTKAVDDLIEEVHRRMRESGVDESMRIKTSIGYLVFWSDSFLRCFIKQKDNSVWILTVTVCPPEGMESSHLYTYILAIGKSGDDHTKVTEHFMKEARDLMEGIEVYTATNNRIERVAFGIATWNADRPERQVLTHTRKEGTYGKVSGWAVRVSEEYLPACVECFRDLAERLLNGYTSSSRKCNKCCNWSFETSPSRTLNGEVISLQMNDEVDEDYPKDYPAPRCTLDEGPRPRPRPRTIDVEPMPEGRTCDLKKMGPVKLTTDWVLKAIRCGYFGVRVGNWGKKNIHSFYRRCNIKTSEADRVLEAALEDKERGVVDAAAVEPMFLKLVECFRNYIFPDLPMHGLAHGIIPDCMEITHTIFAKYKKRQSFFDYANPILEDVASFRLDYCKLKTLPKAAWVGENVMGYARLMCYLYGSYLENNQLGGSEEAAITTHHLKCMWNAFTVLVSYLMSDKKDVDVELIDSHIKIFMSSAHYLHKQHGNLDSSSDDDAGPGQSSKKKNIFLSELGTETLKAMAEVLGERTHGTPHTIRRRINKVTKSGLRKKLETMGVEYTSSMHKSDLQRLICDSLPSNSRNETNGSSRRRPKAETMCWNGGNWLSFMANIPSQIAYLGSLRYIW